METLDQKEKMENSNCKYTKDKRKVKYKQTKKMKKQAKDDKNHLHGHPYWARSQECIICHLLVD